MDLLLCAEEMIPETPEGEGPCRPDNFNDILARRELSVALKFSNDESGPSPSPDDALCGQRVINNLMALEAALGVAASASTFSFMQTTVTPAMRQECVSWMFEVCEAEDFVDFVFLRAVSYFDRILAGYNLLPNQLQLLGVVCLHISLKFHGVDFRLDKLLYYTANSVTKEMIPDWELMVLYGVKWDLATIVASDFVTLFVRSLPKNSLSPQILSHASVYISYCAIDPTFLLVLPSTVAVAGLVAALAFGNPGAGEEALETFHQLTNNDKEMTRAVIEQLKLKVDHLFYPHSPQGQGQGHGQCQSQSQPGTSSPPPAVVPVVVTPCPSPGDANDNTLLAPPSPDTIDNMDMDMELTLAGSSLLEKLAELEEEPSGTPTDARPPPAKRAKRSLSV